MLLVEDHAPTCSELESILAKEGFRVVTAKNGIEAFQKAISEAPGVIVTDKQMPGFDGYMLLQSLKCLPETMRIPVILITSSLSGTEEAEAFDKGFFDYLAKPVRDTTLVTRVKRALQTQTGAI